MFLLTSSIQCYFLFTCYSWAPLQRSLMYHDITVLQPKIEHSLNFKLTPDTTLSVPSQYKDTEYRQCHYKDKTVSPTSYLYNGNPHTWKDRSYIDLLPDTQNCGFCMRRECRERFPHRRLQRKPIVSDPGMHHGACVTHVSWCMWGLLTLAGGQNVPGIPGACAHTILCIWQDAHWDGEQLGLVSCGYLVKSWRCFNGTALYLSGRQAALPAADMIVPLQFVCLITCCTLALCTIKCLVVNPVVSNKYVFLICFTYTERTI